MTIQGGGPVATALVAISRLGGKTAMIDSIGDDWAGALVLDGFHTEGVNTDTVEIRAGYTTSVSNILVAAHNGDRAILWAPGSVPELSLSEAQRSAIRSAKYDPHDRQALGCLPGGRQIGERVACAGFIRRGREQVQARIEGLVPLTDICIVAKGFAENYTGETEISRSAELLLKEGPEIAVVTDGGNGSWIRTKDGTSFHQPAFLFPATVDTTGAAIVIMGLFLPGCLRDSRLKKRRPSRAPWRPSTASSLEEFRHPGI